jgi:hypothetical protein
MVKKFLWYLTIFIIICVAGIGTLWFFNLPSRNAIDRAYHALSKPQTKKLKSQLTQFQLPGQHLATLGLDMGFDSRPTLQTANAFAAGIWLGQQDLLGHHSATLPTSLSPPSPMPSWQETGWKNDFELGRWILLLWAITDSSLQMPAPFWQQQQRILKHFQTQFAVLAKNNDREAQLVISALEPLSPLLAQLAQKPTLPSSHLLERELAFLIDSLSP